MKIKFWDKSTVVLSKHAMSLSVLVCLLKWSVSSSYNGSLSVFVNFNFSETFPGFPCRFFSLSFIFLFIVRVLFINFIRIIFKCILITPLNCSVISIYFQDFWLLWCVLYFFNPGLDTPFDDCGSLCNPGMFLGFDNYYFSLMVLLFHFFGSCITWW